MMHLILNKMKKMLIFFLMPIAIFSSATAEAALTKTEVSQLYVAIFNRASEGEGNSFWQVLPDKATAATQMLATSAAQAYFGSSLNSNQAFIEHIYLNTLNKTLADDPGGIAFWVSALNGGYTRGQVVAELVGVIGNYAPGGPSYNPNDAATIAAYNQFTNRVEVSNYMADTMYGLPSNWETDTPFSPTGLNVTYDSASVNAAKSRINMLAGNTSLEEDVEYYMQLISSVSDMAPMMDDIGTVLNTVMEGDSSVVTITPWPIDLENLPSTINITADFGSGYTPEGSTSVFTGRADINITGLTVNEQSGSIGANVNMNATNIRKDGELLLNGVMTLTVNLLSSGSNIGLTANVNFTNLQSLDFMMNGGIALSIPAISINISNGTTTIPQPVTITFSQLTTGDTQISGTIGLTQVSTDIYDTVLNLTTSQGTVAGTVRLTQTPINEDEDRLTISTPSGPITIEDYSVSFNNVVMDSSICSELPVSGSILITGSSETSTINFSNCTYIVQ